jgi:hypothetical protein
MVRKSFRALARFFTEAHYIHQEPEGPSEKIHEDKHWFISDIPVIEAR